MFTYPNPSDISGGAAAEVRCVSVLVDASNERSFPSSAPSIKRLLPLQSFTRGLISMKSMLLLVPALRLQTPTCLLGLRTYLLSSSSSSLSLLYVPLFKSSQASAGLCLLLRSSFKSRQVGANSLAVFLSFFFLSTFLFSFCGCSLSLYLSFFSKLRWEKSLIYHFEGGKSALVYFYTQPHGFGLLYMYIDTQTNTVIKTYTLHNNTGAHWIKTAADDRNAAYLGHSYQWGHDLGVFFKEFCYFNKLKCSLNLENLFTVRFFEGWESICLCLKAKSLVMYTRIQGVYPSWCFCYHRLVEAMHSYKGRVFNL